MTHDFLTFLQREVDEDASLTPMMRRLILERAREQLATMNRVQRFDR
jgi:hypothetical protein